MKDREAVGLCLKGSQEAFRELVTRYEREALGHALALCGEIEVARDCVQEAFLDAFRSLDRFDLDLPFYPWLYVLIRNRCLKQTRRRSLSMAPGALLLLEAPTGKAGSPQELQDAILKLSALEREILLLKYVDGLSYRQLADFLEIPTGTVMSRLFHARQALRKILEQVQEKSQ